MTFLRKNLLLALVLALITYACTNQHDQEASWEDLDYEYNQLEKYRWEMPHSAQEFRETFKLSRDEFAEFIDYAKEGNLAYMDKFYAEQVLKRNVEVSAEEYQEFERFYNETNWEEELKHGTGSIDFDSEKKNQRGTLTIEP
ncbi:hypothetical protein [Tunicatimonas pelagia]|uniref:hypothetical protein n=1 Tax=Tunicatimonas pelagia TaxID=931531 RepID=UPI002666DD67|nr:hypothetical protein [Tunicatimonas pelagia]WKN41870.1 hypothetical protein P0M28_22785 [Tunicatimonas pelagia]